MDSKNLSSTKQSENQIEVPNAEDIGKFFQEKGLKNTSEWIFYIIKNKLPDPTKDLDDIMTSLRNDIRVYMQEYFNDSNFKEDCFNVIWNFIRLGLSTGRTRFRNLTGELIPLVSKTIQTDKLLEDITKVAQKLDQKPKFYLICFYYLMLMEGNFKNVTKNLLAMKRLREGKDVSVTETLGLVTSEKIEEDKNLKEILPERLKNGKHQNLRNSIAHANFRYIDTENKMEFWDVYPRDQKFSMNPTKLTLAEFSKSLMEVYIFCEVFGFIMLTILAINDLLIRYS
ncbi:MAG: hypothetical protein NUK63_03415 [Candidatus Bathyarchaeum tardum]|nr:MAG: hypothetical protein NUK63_03415 [Candidatus Bathyarchaeum tardum]